MTVEVVAATKGPKIDILKYKNKTGYRKRQGHRQQHTQVKVTGIETGAKAAKTAKATKVLGASRQRQARAPTRVTAPPHAPTNPHET